MTVGRAIAMAVLAGGAGTTDLTETLFNEGMTRHRELPDELGADTQLRELDLLLTVNKGANVEQLIESYQVFRTPPRFVSAAEACDIEPQLNADVIEGAFTIRHGHVNPMGLVTAYNQAFRRLGGLHNMTPVQGLVRVGDKVTGVLTEAQAYPAKTVIVAAGAYSRQLVQAAGLTVPLFFTHAEIIETPPLAVEVRSLIMPAANSRFEKEAEAAEQSSLWQTADTEIMPAVLEAGVIQFADKKLLGLGKSAVFIRPICRLRMRARVGRLYRMRSLIKSPRLKMLRVAGGTVWSPLRKTASPLLGPIPGVSGLHLFSGFTGPFALVPPVAQRYARHLAGKPESLADKMLDQMLVDRFAVSA